ncbi:MULTISPECIES: choloylglycine hydrolase [unclassified Microbacterium]|uniref:choloylglycine hydrolase n=1 Tax=unclassified Microbacterium TaxID=2609290 RepID=UPI00214CAB7F|nr:MULTISPECIES: choloylglycine hydrolase [unclassified Microbacterium]MCR2785573.1 choloylglycine hydrolase [Microbacterium sp. zg.B96]MDL5350305.1 choloylglycine hydrolase [Microbacterium sp. zg-YB36]WIM17440.1 choloylglycine hydrolase [Microbacterium sp. zg-B96]
MCTGANYTTQDHYFGRNLDLEFSYNETVTVTPRNFPFEFRKAPTLATHHAIIGMATIADGYPLYYDATNEKGLSMAGLNFPGNADYKPEASDKTNITPFEFIPWILGQYETVDEVKEALTGLSLVNISFSETFPLSPLHWIISDRTKSITVESVKAGLNVYDNPFGILTNNPTFDIQSFNLNNYMHLSKNPPENKFSDELEFDTYSRGMGAIGLPGDLSSSSRFAKAVFTKMNSVSGDSESESISQFLQILGSVAQQRGAVQVSPGKYEITIYSSCCNTDKGIYYYTTYENSQVTGVDMHKEDLDGSRLVDYPLIKGQQILMQN